MIWPFLELHRNGTTAGVSQVWCLSPSIILSRFIHVVPCINSTFLFTAEQYFIIRIHQLWVYLNIKITPSARGCCGKLSRAGPGCLSAPSFCGECMVQAETPGAVGFELLSTCTAEALSLAHSREGIPHSPLPSPCSQCLTVFRDGQFSFYLLPSLPASLPCFLLLIKWKL